MDFYIDTRNRDIEDLRISGAKGHIDFFNVMSRIGLTCISIPSVRKKDSLTATERILLEARLQRIWRQKLSKLGSGDRLILHNPPSEKFLGLPEVIREVRRRGCRIITVIFDPEQFYLPDYKEGAEIKHFLDRKLEEYLFGISDVIVAHTDVMKAMLAERGSDPEKIISAVTWDYLRDDSPDPEDINRRVSKDKPVTFCGNLSKGKSGFIYELDDMVRIDLYGPYYTGSDTHNLHYKGIYRAEELMDRIEGSFGLVWDGPSADSCIGTYGEYLRYNIPHKASLYLASGMPVIIWEEAAMADFILNNQCGITVKSIRDIPERIKSITDAEYDAMKNNALRIGADMRKGKYISAFINEALEKVKAVRKAVILFTREPVPGKTKTRLMPYLNGKQCADLHECFIKDLFCELKKADAELIVAYTGGKPERLRRVFGDKVPFIEQRGSNIGDKMKNAIADVLAEGYDRVVLTGTDIPEMKHETVDEALSMLDDADVVICPTEDGGYYLIGMSKVCHEAFDVSNYGVSTVFDETVDSLNRSGLTVAAGECYSDIDTPEDLAEFRRRIRHDKRMQNSYTGRYLAENAGVSVIIPVYNEEKTIDRLLVQLEPYRDQAEIVFVDGGSSDATLEHIGDEFKVIQSEKGRGCQMNAGAEVSHGDILFFLHCDSILPDDFITQIRKVMAHSDWGCFGVRFPSMNFFMLTNRIISNHRANVRGIPFGDQGIFVDRLLFEEAGGFCELPVMEDYEFSLRMKKNRYHPGMTSKRITTSPRRYGQGTKNIIKTEFDMWNMRRLFRKGVCAEEIAKDYKDIR